MSAYREILMQAVYERRNAGSLWMSWVLLALALICYFSVGFGAHDWTLGLIFSAIFLILLIAMWGSMLLSSFMRQNTPSNAQLVPYLRQRLIRAVLFIWLFLSLAVAVALALAHGHFGFWFVVVGICILYFSSLLRSQWLAWIWVVWCGMLVTFDMHMSAIQKDFFYSNEIILVAIGIFFLAIIGVLCVQWIFPKGGDGHWRRYEKFAAMRETIRTGIAQGNASTPTLRLNAIINFGYSTSLKSACAKRLHSMRMLMYVLGPGCDWSIGLFSSGVTLLFAVLLRIWNMKYHSSALLGMGPTIALVYAMFPIVVFLQNVPNWMHKTVTEQGLMRLTPIAPAVNQFNRLLAKNLLARFAVLWSISTITGLLAGLLLGAKLVDLVMSLSLSMSFLLGAGLLFADYAKMNVPYGTSKFVRLFIGLITINTTFFLVQKVWYPIPWLVFGVACFIISAIIVRFRWAIMLQSSIAFPAGRLAN